MDECRTALRRLCRWAAATGPDAVPADVAARIGAVAADTIACALGASSDPELAAWVRDAGDAASRGMCTVLGWPHASHSPSTAAARNAIAANWLQLDEGHHHLMCHGGIYCVPAALAECEAADRSLGQFLHAVTLGYEMTCRLAGAWTFGAAPVHPHSLWSTLGATATLALLRGLDGDTLCQALLHAVTFAAPRPFSVVADGGLAANLWVGSGVEQAFACTARASNGLPAPRHALERLGGMLGVQGDATVYTKDLGHAWAVRRSYFKAFPCAGQSHAALEALLDVRASLVSQGTDAFEDSVRIDAEVHDFAVSMARRDIPTSLAARFSIPHLLAVAWLHGRTDAQALGTEFLCDARVARLREAIHLVPLRPVLPPPHHRAARVTVTLNEGRSAQGYCVAPMGSEARPFKAGDIERKCHELARGHHATLLRTLLDPPHFSSDASAVKLRTLLHHADVCQ